MDTHRAKAATRPLLDAHHSSRQLAPAAPAQPRHGSPGAPARSRSAKNPGRDPWERQLDPPRVAPFRNGLPRRQAYCKAPLGDLHTFDVGAARRNRPLEATPSTLRQSVPLHLTSLPPARPATSIPTAPAHPSDATAPNPRSPGRLLPHHAPRPLPNQGRRPSTPQVHPRPFPPRP